jgi:hypothetical protein
MVDELAKKLVKKMHNFPPDFAIILVSAVSKSKTFILTLLNQNGNS